MHTVNSAAMAKINRGIMIACGWKVSVSFFRDASYADFPKRNLGLRVGPRQPLFRRHARSKAQYLSGNSSHHSKRVKSPPGYCLILEAN